MIAQIYDYTYTYKGKMYYYTFLSDLKLLSIKYNVIMNGFTTDH